MGWLGSTDVALVVRPVRGVGSTLGCGMGVKFGKIEVNTTTHGNGWKNNEKK